MHLNHPLHNFLQRLYPGLLLVFGLSSCTAWQPAAEFEGWTLYVEDGAEVDMDRYTSTFDVAFEAVEDHFGLFTDSVAVHAISGSVSLNSGNRGTITGEEDRCSPGTGPVAGGQRQRVMRLEHLANRLTFFVSH